MSNPIATRQTVYQAAEALKAAGTMPSWRRVKAAIKGGSPATICPLLAEWRAQQDGSNETTRSVVVPDQIADMAKNLVTTIYDAANADAKRLIEAATVAAQKDISAMQYEIDIAAEEEAMEIRNLREDITRLTEANAILSATADRLQIELEAAREAARVAVARESVGERDRSDLQQEVRTLREQNAELAAQGAAHGTALAAARQEATRSQHDLERARSEVTERTLRAHHEATAHAEALNRAEADRDAALADARAQLALSEHRAGELAATQKQCQELLARLAPTPMQAGRDAHPSPSSAV